MTETLASYPFPVQEITDPTATFRQDVLQGLSLEQKRLSSVYFYDEQGSQLFEQICDLDEYYLTGKETEILERSAAEIIQRLPTETHFIELGSGSSTKTRILLKAALKQFSTLRYSPIDVSYEILASTAQELQQRFPRLNIEPFSGLYEAGLEYFLGTQHTPSLIMWLGSSIGNLTRLEAVNFLQIMGQLLSPDDSVLVGIDLRKEATILEPAYTDAAGITAAFNLNLLTRINTTLGGHFQLDNFRHAAFYNAQMGRVEMYLVSQIEQDVAIDALGRIFHFGATERILTEYSHKYSLTEIKNLAEQAGYMLQQQWLDAKGWFSLNLLTQDYTRNTPSNTRRI